MSLRSLLKKINSQKKIVLERAPKHSNVKVTLGEIYIFENYLLQLQEIKVKNKKKVEKVRTKINEINQILSLLTRSAPNYLNPNLQGLKETQKKYANYFLIESAKYNNEVLLKIALKMEANSNFQQDGESALIHAVRKRNYRIVADLLKAGADVNMTQGLIFPETALIAAVERNDLRLVKLLIKSGAEINARVQDKTALSTAYTNRVSCDLIHYLLSIPNINMNEKFSKVRSEQRSVLSIALWNLIKDPNDLPLRYLLRTPGLIKKNKDFYTAISVGLPAVQLMIEAGYEITKDIVTKAIGVGNSQILDVLIKQPNADFEGARISLNQNHNYNDLMFYVAIGNIGKVKELLLSSVDLEVKNKNNKTALMIAAELGRNEIVALLVQAGAHVDATNEKGQSSLMLAAEKGYYNSVKLLLDNKADINQRELSTFSNYNALELAVTGNHANIAKLLLQVSTDNNIDFVQGLNSKNEEIAQEYKIRFTELLLPKLNSALENQLSYLKPQIFPLNFNSNYKMQLVEDALKRVKNSAYKFGSLHEYLNYKVDGQSSIMDALSYRRIGFFGETQSKKDIQKLVNTLETTASSGDKCILIAN